MKNSYNYGFTLLEMVLAIAIFSIMSLTVYQILQSTFQSADIFKRKSKRLVNIQRAIGFLERDISHAIIRQSSLSDSPSNTDFFAGVGTLFSSDYGIELVRNNWLNPGGILSRSNLERVGYRIQNNKLERLSYRYPDNIPDIYPSITPILDQVIGFRFKFHHNGQWINQWNYLDILPKGIEVSLELEDIGVVKKIVLLTTKGYIP